jgi:hypothetical protein
VDLIAARAKRWWRTGRRIGSIERAAAFIDDVGFAVLFPKKGLDLPNLWDTVSNREVGEVFEDGWDDDSERLWGWKDELPLRRLAWYGEFVHKRKSFLSPGLLGDLYPREGVPDDYKGMTLEDDSRRVADVLHSSGPLPAPVIREATSMDGRADGPRFNRALAVLGRALVITHYGVEDQGAGWPSAVYELTARAFHVSPKKDVLRAHRRAAGRYLETMILAEPAGLARAFNWPLADARARLDELCDEKRARKLGNRYRSVE